MACNNTLRHEGNKDIKTSISFLKKYKSKKNLTCISLEKDNKKILLIKKIKIRIFSNIIKTKGDSVRAEILSC